MVFTPQQNSLPTELLIVETYPNPFNPSLTVNVTLRDAVDLTVKVFDILGREVALLANGKYESGNHQFLFNTGQEYSSGIYFIQANVPGKLNEVRKVVLMK